MLNEFSDGRPLSPPEVGNAANLLSFLHYYIMLCQEVWRKGQEMAGFLAYSAEVAFGYEGWMVGEMGETARISCGKEAKSG